MAPPDLAPPGATGPDGLRERLVAGLRAEGVLNDDRVAAALRDVPRHVFLPQVEPERAYTDGPVVIKQDEHGNPISAASQPAIVALMLEQLAVRPGDRVLEIGAGTGYNAALLAHLSGAGGHVTTVDLDADLVAGAREHLARAGFGQVRTVQGDGGLGWPDGAPYDRIILTVGAWDITPAWVHQLASGGRLVLPLAMPAALQYTIAFERVGGHLESVSVLPCGFMRLRGAFAGPETLVWLGDEAVVLAETGPRPAGSEPLQDLLSQPGETVATGVQVTPQDLHAGLGAWLSLREPDRVGRLTVPRGAAAPAAEPAPAPASIPATVAAAIRHRGMLLVSSAHGCATLVPARDEDRPRRTGAREAFEIGVQPFGREGFNLAARLTGHIRDWVSAGRPSLAGLRVSAYPDGVTPAGPPGATVIRKPHGSLVLTWHKPGECGNIPPTHPGQPAS